MAPPAEKTRAMLNKWVKMREQGNEDNTNLPARKSRRPHLANDCEHLADAEYYRSQIIREISAKIAKIQNPGLGEHALRDLNDEINKRMREKYHWNKRIKELGGVDYIVLERKKQIEEGTAVVEGPIYRYYGAAKDLPGVRELLAKQEAKWKKKIWKKKELHKRVTPDYFGWRDEEDGILVELEAKQVQKIDMDHNNQINTKRQKQIPMDDDDNDDDKDYLDVPSPEDIAQVLFEHKKRELLFKFSI